MLGGGLRRESGWGRASQGYTVLVCTSDSDDGMVKNSGMASCRNRSHQGSEAGGRECVCERECVLVGKLLTLMDEDQGASAPSKE